MKPIYVDEAIYNFLASQKKDYGSFSNVVKAVLRKLGSLQEEVSSLNEIIEKNNIYVQNVLLESVKHPQMVSSYSGNKTLNVLPTGPPTPRIQPIPKEDLQRDLQKVFDALGDGQIKPSDFSKLQEEIIVLKPLKKLTPPPSHIS